jgi:site-specific recombinase XerD
MTTDFLGPFADCFRRFVAHKRALGRRYHTEDKALHLFDRYLGHQGITDRSEVTPKVIEAFLISRPRASPRSYNHLLGVLDRCFTWLVVQGLLDSSPVRIRPRRATRQRIPFLFDQAQARRLLQVAAELPNNSRAVLRGPTYRMIFALLYGLGLRVGEVARLCRNDVDFQNSLLVIRHTKFSKSRLVPFGPRMAENIRDFIRDREQLIGEFPPDSPLFSFTKGQHLNPGTISQNFHALVPRLDLAIPPGVTPPRVHDLRHSFAVGTLRRWYRTGSEPGQRLHYLATFLGHVQPESTAVYLTITEDLLQEANSRFAAFSVPAIKEDES